MIPLLGWKFQNSRIYPNNNPKTTYCIVRGSLGQNKTSASAFTLMLPVTKNYINPKLPNC